MHEYDIYTLQLRCRPRVSAVSCRAAESFAGSDCTSSIPPTTSFVAPHASLRLLVAA